MPHEKTTQANTQSAILTGPFSPQEAERLHAVRARLLEKEIYLTRVQNEQRRRFARYLLEIGAIGEDEA
jgi:hypothetical protein